IVASDDAWALWTACAEELKETMPAGAWRGCIQPLSPISMDHDALALGAPNLLVKERLENEHHQAVLSALQQAAGYPITLIVEVTGEGERADMAIAPAPIATASAPGQVDES